MSPGAVREPGIANEAGIGKTKAGRPRRPYPIRAAESGREFIVSAPAGIEPGRGTRPDYSSAPPFFFVTLDFLAAVLARLASSAASTFFSISVIEPPAFSTAARAEAEA